MTHAGVTEAPSPRPADAPGRPLTVALLGNPNTGKTTLFNALSGLRQRVGNYPGVTVEKKTGRFVQGGRAIDLIDLPGTYSLAPRSPDEMVAVDVLLGRQEGLARPDVVVSIVDAANLERNLYLTTQLLDLGLPVVIALNMVDVAERLGRTIDAERLAAQLGVPVVPIQANKKRGLERLREAIAEAAAAHTPPAGPLFPPAFEEQVAELRTELAKLAPPGGEGEAPAFLVRRLVLDVGGHTERRLVERYGPAVAPLVAAARERLRAAGCPVPVVEARVRYAWIREKVQGCVRRPAERPVTLTDRLDRLLTHKVWGTLVFLALMFLVFQSIFLWARPLMDLIGAGQSALGGWVERLLPPGPLRSLLVDGVIQGVGSVLLFLPQIVILFGFIAVLEDCGYMARAAFLMDRLMARCGLSGKSFIPLLSSFACAIPGVMATRVIEDRRDRLATILIAPLMSCSARLPVYTLLTGAFLTYGYAWWVPGLTIFGLYLLGIVLAPVVALVLKRTLLRGETPVFIMELPAYKLPSPGLVLHRMYDRGKAFVYRAGTLILASMVVVWAALYFPATGLDGEGRVIDYDRRVAELKEQLENARVAVAGLEQRLKDVRAAGGPAAEVESFEGQLGVAQAGLEPIEAEIHRLQGEWKRTSVLGRLGRMIEPAVRPLGWDWRIGMAALASFPAREVVVGTLGIIYEQGDVDAGEIDEAGDVRDTGLGQALVEATWDDDPGRKVFTVPVALSLMVFFALCCQCASTLAVIRRETNSWRWPLFTFAYMTALAYVGALVTYQVGSLF